MLALRPSRTGATLLLVCSIGVAQTRHDGSAVVRVADTEHTIPIVCESAAQPELGFSTEPARITREATGRTSGVNLRVRPWQDTGNLIVTLDRYVAWVPTALSADGVLSMRLDMSPSSTMQADGPAMLTYDLWMSGERPPGLVGVQFEANCNVRDPAAPSSRRLPASGSP